MAQPPRSLHISDLVLPWGGRAGGASRSECHASGPQPLSGLLGIARGGLSLGPGLQPQGCARTAQRLFFETREVWRSSSDKTRKVVNIVTGIRYILATLFGWGEHDVLSTQTLSFGAFLLYLRREFSSERLPRRSIIPRAARTKCGDRSTRSTTNRRIFHVLLSRRGWSGKRVQRHTGWETPAAYVE